MDIETAIQTVRDLLKDLRDINGAIRRIEEFDDDASLSVKTYATGNINIVINNDDCLKLLKRTKAHHEAKIAKMQPVIDMANAALKGINS